MPLFSEVETQNYLENKRCISGLSHADIMEIHKKSEGLPLYLQYAAEILILSNSIKDAIASLAPASGGDIRNYYGLLWKEFDRVGMANSRLLCVVMSCLRFGVHRDELYKIANINRPTFEDAYKCVCHLLRDSDDRLTVFHNSFREFVASQVSDDWIMEIRKNIGAFLKTNKDSPRWFAHAFKYCYDAEDYKYILEEVNAEFVDRALLHCRSTQEILDAIHWAVESAFMMQNIVQLSRLSTLKFRTSERLEYNLDRVLLADALLALGREQDVMSFAYLPESNHWLVDSYTSLAVMSRLAEEGRLELGRRLFDIFINEFRGVHSDNIEEEKSQVVGVAKCLGIYAQKQARPLRWLSTFNLKPSLLEQKDTFVPKYMPHLQSYIDALVQFGYTEKWNRLKRINRLFSNDLIQYLLIRSLARYNHVDELRSAVCKYLEEKHPTGNLELAFFAAQARMSTSDVMDIAGTIAAPKMICPDQLFTSDPILRYYVYSFIVMAYEANEKSYTSLCENTNNVKTLWSSAIQHILKACFCIGRSFRSAEYEWYDEAHTSIASLIHAEQGEGERICDSINLIRDILPLTIGHLTEQVHKRYPQNMGKWIECLSSMRDSLLWNTHFGISESRQDYNFELELWETLARIPQVCHWLVPILKNCAQTYKKSTMLKGGCRSSHFIRLSAIMGKCGMRDEAETWLEYGIHASHIYGSHKDVTLLYLIDVLKLVNKRQPEMALARCARVLSMLKWMPHLTDGRETKWFAEEIFDVVLNVNRRAAFDLLKHFSQNIARWKMQNCLEKYLLSSIDEDPEYMWILTELFTNQSSREDANCKQIMGTRQHIVDLVQKDYSKEIPNYFEKKFRHFVLTEISPRNWPNQLKEEFNILIDTDVKNVRTADLPAIFTLDGKSITKEDIVKKCQVSFQEFLETIEKLKKQNEHFYEKNIVEDTMRHLILTAKSSDDLMPIKKYTESQGRIQNSNIIERLAERFVEFGDQNSAIECFGLAYACYGSWFRWRSNSKYLAAVEKRDRQAARAFVLKECYESTSDSGDGYNTAPIAAAGLDVLNEPQMLNNVFNDFLIHCESMFSQLPQNNDYLWLKEYKEPPVNTNQLILNFVIDELSTPEFDLGERLVMAITRLAIARPEDAIHVLASRIVSASGRILHRLLTVFHSIATQHPHFLAQYQQTLCKLLDRNDFFCNGSVER